MQAGTSRFTCIPNHAARCGAELRRSFNANTLKREGILIERGRIPPIAPREAGVEVELVCDKCGGGAGRRKRSGKMGL